MRLFMTLLVSFLLLPAIAQERYYLSFADLLQGNYHDTHFTLQQRSKRGKGKHLGGDYKPHTLNPKVRKQLKKKARFIEKDSRLFVNVNGLYSESVRLGKWYAPCFFIDSTKIVFTSVRRDRASQLPSAFDYVDSDAYDKVESEDGKFLDHVLSYISLRGDARRRAAKVRACYLMYSDDIHDIRIIDTAYMRMLLQFRPDLEEQYLKIDPRLRESPEVIFNYLVKAGLRE
ncbi:MAG: hypothetical protein IJV27_08565 [Prevotella sp.]|nr:hypothetical protein [Prevotella sp.]